ncbi:SH3 domain-containing protein [Tianweitania sp. BSSL-BM11]|uniref:SH3 domain-containing protein n=2 Tax=Tianweitania aestuarii TaxID=2814886 RepID=A0ABS5RQC0_9HYPH|nr:SH3 domain-containing protein [Tianweitania aestuarii]
MASILPGAAIPSFAQEEPAKAQEEAAPKEGEVAVVPDAFRRGSGLPLPRFVSLKSGRVNSRVGPGVNYAVDWMYLKSGMPMEIIQEYDNWRRVRDPDGSEGWVNQSLLSGRRTAIVAPWQRGKPDAAITVMSEPNKDASVVVRVEPGVIGTIKTCNGSWCEMTFDGREGWISQALLWGAYPGETVKD